MNQLKNRHKKIVYSMKIKKNQELSYDKLAKALFAIFEINPAKARCVLYSGGIHSLLASAEFLGMKEGEKNMLERIIKSVSIEKELENNE